MSGKCRYQVIYKLDGEPKLHLCTRLNGNGWCSKCGRFKTDTKRGEYNAESSACAAGAR